MGQASDEQDDCQGATEPSRAEQAIREHEDELAAIYDAAPLIIMLVDEERRVRKVNKFAEQFAGTPAASILGLRGGEALHCLHALDDPQGCGFGPHCQHCMVRRSVLDTLETGRSHNQVEVSLPFAVEGKAQDLMFLLSTTRVKVRGQPRVLVTLQDITARKQAERAMANLASFPKLNPCPISEVDLEGRVHFLNPAAERLFPDLRQRGRVHPWLADWETVTQRLRENDEGSIVRDAIVGA